MLRGVARWKVLFGVFVGVATPAEPRGEKPPKKNSTFGAGENALLEEEKLGP